MQDRDACDWSIFAGRLRHDHELFAKRFGVLRRGADVAGWRSLTGAWSGFASDVIRHMAFEELAVFPDFARHRRGHADELGTLIDEHAQLRGFLDVLTARIGRGVVTDTALENFAELMTRHEDVETRLIDPWLELQERRGFPARRLGT